MKAKYLIIGVQGSRPKQTIVSIEDDIEGPFDTTEILRTTPQDTLEAYALWLAQYSNRTYMDIVQDNVKLKEEIERFISEGYSIYWIKKS